MLKGTAVFHVDGKIETLGLHQGILIEPMSKHFIANETSEDIDFILISQPDNASIYDRVDVSE